VIAVHIILALILAGLVLITVEALIVNPNRRG
jgi:hypothetical protein